MPEGLTCAPYAPLSPPALLGLRRLYGTGLGLLAPTRPLWHGGTSHCGGWKQRSCPKSSQGEAGHGEGVTNKVGVDYGKDGTEAG